MGRRFAALAAFISLLALAIPVKALEGPEGRTPLLAAAERPDAGAAESDSVELDAPARAYGPVELRILVDLPDLASWRLTVTDPEGVETVLKEGTDAGETVVTWETGTLAEGRYRLRLTAADRSGREVTDQTRITVSNQSPSLSLSQAKAEQDRTFLPVGYSSTTAADISLVVRYPGSLNELARGELRGAAAGENRVVDVPVDLSRLLVGRYVVAVQIRDSQGRSVSGEFSLQVVPSAPRAQLEELPAVSGQEVTLTWLIPTGASSFEVRREGPDGTTVLPVPSWLPSTMRLTVVDRPDVEGRYTYKVISHTTDGLQAESVGRSTFVDLNPPELGQISVSPVDGIGLNMRWTPAADAGGLAAYRISLWDGAHRLQLAELDPTAQSYATALNPGSYQVILTAVDKLGQEADSAPLSFRVQPGAVAFLVDGMFLDADVAGAISDDQTWVPVRLFSDALGYPLLWDQSRRIALIMDPAQDRVVLVGVGDATLQTLSSEGAVRTELPAAPRIVENRMMVPLRPLAEALGARVKWIQETRTVELIRAAAGE